MELIVLDLWALRIVQFGDKITSDSHSDSRSQSQVFSTLEADDSETDGARSTLRNPKGGDNKLGDVPNLLDCLALCYLGTLTLRLPITPGDIYHWVTEDKLAYRGAIKRLPLSMRDRLPPSYHAILNPNALLKYKRFYASVTQLQISFTKDNKISWPPLNYRLLLFRYLKVLALPLEVYDFTIRLSKLLGYDFTLHQDRKKRLGIRHLPEAQLVGCLVVCVKLLYPFDGEQRHPRSAAEPTVAAINWSHWHNWVQNGREREKGAGQRLNVEELTRLKECDVFDMTPDRLDQYLDFYTDTFLDDAEIRRVKDADDFRNAVYGMFPTDMTSAASAIQTSGQLPEKDDTAMVRAVHGSMEARVAVNDSLDIIEILRPGESYSSYKKEEDLPEQARVFYEETAKLAGFSMDMLMMAVLYTEIKIEKWWRKQSEANKQRNAHN